MKSVNVTVRIDAELKALAEQAAEVMDVSLSSVVRRAFRELIRNASVQLQGGGRLVQFERLLREGSVKK
jgi:antitoxin component of RelBE/YafQ-DinJ toxin-antitoxin module